MVEEFVKGTIEDIRVELTPDVAERFGSVLSEWNVKKTDKSLQIVSEDCKKMMLLTNDNTRIVCSDKHGGNEKNLREIRDAILRVVNSNGMSNGTEERIRKIPVITQLVYNSLPSDIESRTVYHVLEALKNSQPELVIIKDGDLVYKFNEGSKKKFIVAYTKPLDQVPEVYPDVSSKFVFSGSHKITYIS